MRQELFIPKASVSATAVWAASTTALERRPELQGRERHQGQQLPKIRLANSLSHSSLMAIGTAPAKDLAKAVYLRRNMI